MATETLYDVLHHTVDKLGAKDEGHLNDLHDTITAHALGFESLSDYRADLAATAARLNPQAETISKAQAVELLKTIQDQRALVERLLAGVQAGAAADAAAESGQPTTPTPRAAADALKPRASKKPAAKKPATKKAKAAGAAGAAATV